jgi:hypothetical protein
MVRWGVVVGALVSLGGCVPAPQVMTPQPGQPNAWMPPGYAAQAAQACATQANMMAEAYCRDMRGSSPEALQAVLSHARQGRAALTQTCADPAAQQHFARTDECIAALATLTEQETAEATTRRAAAGPQVAAVKADPSWAPLRDRVRGSRDEMAMACESAQNARDARSPNLGAWQRQCTELNAAHEAAAAEMRALLSGHGVDLRDSEALGLW